MSTLAPRTLVRSLFLSAAVALVVLSLWTGHGRARTVGGAITVNDTGDNTTTDGKCTLREAIANANNDAATSPDCAAGSGADTISFSVTGTITLASALPDITTPMTVNGPGASQLTVSGGNSVRVFTVNVASPNVATFSGLTVANGKADNGGGINNVSTGTVNFINSTLSNNSALNNGGGIYSNGGGTVNVTNSTLSGNFTSSTVSCNAGGIYNGRGVLNVTNSTLSGNSANPGSGYGSGGGGITSGSGATTVIGSTLSGNFAATLGGGIYKGGAGPVSVGDSIIAKNTAPSFGPDLSGGFTSLGYNLVGNNDSEVGITNGTNNDQVGTAAVPLDPRLGPLADNGGPTKTMALLYRSPAIDKGKDLSATGKDQRGLTRPVDLADYANAASGDASDIGAYEAQTAPPDTAPVASATPSPATTDEDTAVQITLSASDADGDATTFTITQSPANGQLTGQSATPSCSASGGTNTCTLTVTYTPASNYNGSDSFKFKANDGAADSNEVTVSITVNAVNDPPVANADTATAVEAGGTNNGTAGTNISGYNVITGVGAGSVADTDPDGDTLTVQGILDGNQGSSPINGNVGAGLSANAPNDYGVITMHSDGSYNYVVNQNNATVQALRTSSDVIDDVFTYTVRDPSGATSNATITIHITGANDAPVASDDSYSTDEDTALSVSAANGVLANDSDVDTAHSSLTASIVAGPAHASSFTLNSDGSFDYTPSADYNGSDSFTYKASDGALDSNTATVTLTVNAVPDLFVSDVSQAEGDSGTSTFDFTVSLDSPATGNGVGFDVSTADGTATAGSDYVAISNRHYTIPQGQSSTTVSVQVNGDTTPEVNETFFVNITNVTGAQTFDPQTQATGVIRNDDVVTAGQVVFSEFRFRGPGGSNDEFIELSNQTDSDVTVATTGGSEGWAVVAYNPSIPSQTVIYIVPVGVVIPARGHFLITNSGAPALPPDAGGVGPLVGIIPSGGYSLGGYAQPDQTDAGGTQATYNYDIPDNGGIALYNTSDPQSFSDTTRLDAVGFTAAPGFYEDTPLSPSTGVTEGSDGLSTPPQFSFTRKLASGRPQDTNKNSDDFVLVSVRPDLITSATAEQGAPGPENTASPVNRGDLIKARLIDSTQGVNSLPNRARSSSPYADTLTPSDPTGNAPGTVTYANGWLAIRRRFVNNTGAEVTGLRFRVVSITANRLNTPNANGTADIRALSSPGITVTSHDPVVCGANPSCSVSVKGLTVDQEGPMAQPRGGGLNTSLSLDLSGNPIPIGGKVDVEFRLGVQEPGAFSFFVIVEALPGVVNTARADAGGPPPPASFDSTKRAGASAPDGLPGKGAPARRKQ